MNAHDKSQSETISPATPRRILPLTWLQLRAYGKDMSAIAFGIYATLCFPTLAFVTTLNVFARQTYEVGPGEGSVNVGGKSTFDKAKVMAVLKMFLILFALPLMLFVVILLPVPMTLGYVAFKALDVVQILILVILVWTIVGAIYAIFVSKFCGQRKASGQGDGALPEEPELVSEPASPDYKISGIASVSLQGTRMLTVLLRDLVSGMPDGTILVLDARNADLRAAYRRRGFRSYSALGMVGEVVGSRITYGQQSA